MIIGMKKIYIIKNGGIIDKYYNKTPEDFSKRYYCNYL